VQPPQHLLVISHSSFACSSTSSIPSKTPRLHNTYASLSRCFRCICPIQWCHRCPTPLPSCTQFPHPLQNTALGSTLVASGPTRGSHKKACLRWCPVRLRGSIGPVAGMPGVAGVFGVEDVAWSKLGADTVVGVGGCEDVAGEDAAGDVRLEGGALVLPTSSPASELRPRLPSTLPLGRAEPAREAGFDTGGESPISKTYARGE